MTLAITVWNHLASLVMPDNEHRNGFFYLLVTPMIDACIPQYTVNLCGLGGLVVIALDLQAESQVGIPLVSQKFSNH